MRVFGCCSAEGDDSWRGACGGPRCGNAPGAVAERRREFPCSREGVARGGLPSGGCPGRPAGTSAVTTVLCEQDLLASSAHLWGERSRGWVRFFPACVEAFAVLVVMMQTMRFPSELLN